MAGDWITIGYLDEPATPGCWQHRSLEGLFQVGMPVRLHEEYYVLGGPPGWFSVFACDGLGPVPEPEEPELWAAERSAGIVDLCTGVALPTDHE